MREEGAAQRPWSDEADWVLGGAPLREGSGVRPAERERERVQGRR